jgi:homoserine dehydrogenase
MTSVRTINIGVCGLGTVGQGVWKHFGRMRAELESRLGARIVLRRAAVKNPAKARGVRVPASKLTGDAMAVATDPQIQIVCELIGGTGIAREVTLAALSRGKIVVSANKALICAHGAEIFAAARRHGGHFLFEASVAGGIPLIKAVREGLVANRFPQLHPDDDGGARRPVFGRAQGGEAAGVRGKGGVAGRRGLGHRAQGLDPSLAGARGLGSARTHGRRGD